MDFIDTQNHFSKDDRPFYICLALSLVVHISIIAYLSWEKIQILTKTPRQIEVTYQIIEKKVIREIQEDTEMVEAVEERQMPKKIKVLSKESYDLPIFGKTLKDISKISENFRFSQKESPKIKTLDVSRNISIPMLKSEKISNPKYMSYNQNIRQKIKQQAYRYVDNPKFQSGEVYLTFIIRADGGLSDLQVIEGKSHANDFLKNAGLRSIKEANPFPPFPKDLNYPELTFNVVISFEVNE